MNFVDVLRSMEEITKIGGTYGPDKEILNTCFVVLSPKDLKELSRSIDCPMPSLLNSSDEVDPVD